MELNVLKGLADAGDRIKGAYEQLWKHPETGFREWKTNEFLINEYKKLGYEPKVVGDIPGFIVDISTGRPGPTVAIFGEMDALVCASHPECDPETGVVHACGHASQSAALLGIAIALSKEGALEGMSGSIKLVAVPAEELIEMEFRGSLMKKGTIKYFGGKQEFIYRGLLDDVDLAIMIHNSSSRDKNSLGVTLGSNGFMTKLITFHGKAAHAGGAPYKGINALYAATQALSAINALRETFMDKNHVRVHPIITKGGDVVNTIPDEVVMECYVRAADANAIRETNAKVSRAIAGSAAALGASVTIDDKMGYLPRLHDKNMMQLALEGAELAGIKADYKPEGWGGGSSDFGDITSLVPAVHPYIGGSIGEGHGANYYVEDPETVGINSAKVQLAMLWLLLKDDAQRAKQIMAEFKPAFANKKEYLEYVDSMTAVREAVSYQEDGSILLKY